MNVLHVVPNSNDLKGHKITYSEECFSCFGLYNECHWIPERT